jgi:hypothetical protein
MPSIVWGRDPQEAIEEPYEYECQDQFCREATNIINDLLSNMEQYTMTFTRDDRSVQKAIWMLQNDALDSLRDILDSLKVRKHRIAGKLFRDVIESLNLAAYFHAEVSSSRKYLNDWYEDEVIRHSRYRDYLSKEYGDEARKSSAEFYGSVSKFTHRTYHILLYGYVLGAEDKLSYDGYMADSGILILPQTISMYFAMLSHFIFIASGELHRRGLISESIIEDVWAKHLEKETVPRRFKPMREIVEEARAKRKNKEL